VIINNFDEFKAGTTSTLYVIISCIATYSVLNYTVTIIIIVTRKYAFVRITTGHTPDRMWSGFETRTHPKEATSMSVLIDL